MFKVSLVGNSTLHIVPSTSFIPMSVDYHWNVIVLQVFTKDAIFAGTTQIDSMDFMVDNKNLMVRGYNHKIIQPCALVPRPWNMPITYCGPLNKVRIFTYSSYIQVDNWMFEWSYIVGITHRKHCLT